MTISVKDQMDGGEPNAELFTQIVMRGEFLRRSDLWMTALVHAGLLLVVFFALLILSDAAIEIWPALRLANEPTYLDISRLVLLVMAGWIFKSTLERSLATRRAEFDLWKAEIKEIQQRAPHS